MPARITASSLLRKVYFLRICLQGFASPAKRSLYLTQKWTIPLFAANRTGSDATQREGRAEEAVISLPRARHAVFRWCGGGLAINLSRSVTGSPGARSR